MVTIKFVDKIDNKQVQSIACFVRQDDLLSDDVVQLADSYFPPLKEHFEQLHFSGQLGRNVVIPVQMDNHIITLFFIGLGKKNNNQRDIEQFRRAVGSLIKAMQSRTINSCMVYMPSTDLFANSTYSYLAEQATISANMASYRFDDYITDAARRVSKDLALTFVAANALHKDIELGMRKGSIIAQAVNQVRHWVDLPPSALTPSVLVKRAQTIAQEHGLGITVFNEETIKKMGMGGLAAVSAGSHEDCALIILEYKTEKKNAPTIALVGKGITFDSGGLSLKPANSMETMKDDMSGAAVVINALQALAQLKPDINVIALAPTSENLPSGTATKPGDIVRFYNGKTAEIRNTDAEGRLILADALSYAVKHYKLDAIIDIATLTGACAHALGPFFTGMMGQHEWLLERIEQAAHYSGDRVWRLPFDNDYKASIVCDVADICNIGKSNYKAGAITAGFFLQHFVDDVPWVHLDIAGTAFDVPDISYYVHGATGAGLRLLVDLVVRWTDHKQ